MQRSLTAPIRPRWACQQGGSVRHLQLLAGECQRLQAMHDVIDDVRSQEGQMDHSAPPASRRRARSRPPRDAAGQGCRSGRRDRSCDFRSAAGERADTSSRLGCSHGEVGRPRGPPRPAPLPPHSPPAAETARRPTAARLPRSAAPPPPRRAPAAPPPRRAAPGRASATCSIPEPVADLELAAGALGDLAAVVDHRDPVGEPVRLVEILGGEQDGDPGGGELARSSPRRRPRPGIEPGGGLVEEEHPRRHHQRGGDV